MKMKKILSISALAVAISTCASMSAFAAEAKGNRKEAVKQIAIHAYKGEEVVNKLGITTKTPVNSYVNSELIEALVKSITEDVKNESVKKQVIDVINNGYNEGKSFDEMFKQIMAINNDKADITTDETFLAARGFMKSLLIEFSEADNLESKITTYFNTKNLNGNLLFGKNSNNRTVVTLERDGQVILQVSSENVLNAAAEIDDNVQSWEDLKNYFIKIS